MAARAIASRNAIRYIEEAIDGPRTPRAGRAHRSECCQGRGIGARVPLRAGAGVKDGSGPMVRFRTLIGGARPGTRSLGRKPEWARSKVHPVEKVASSGALVCRGARLGSGSRALDSAHHVPDQRHDAKQNGYVEQQLRCRGQNHGRRSEPDRRRCQSEREKNKCPGQHRLTGLPQGRRALPWPKADASNQPPSNSFACGEAAGGC